jgi:hypothetical protein
MFEPDIQQQSLNTTFTRHIERYISVTMRVALIQPDFAVTTKSPSPCLNKHSVFTQLTTFRTKNNITCRRCCIGVINIFALNQRRPLAIVIIVAVRRVRSLNIFKKKNTHTHTHNNNNNNNIAFENRNLLSTLLLDGLATL